jgi:hypothetical protein
MRETRLFSIDFIGQVFCSMDNDVTPEEFRFSVFLPVFFGGDAGFFLC